ncbi:MAG: TetR/AcrR family transcriptional regulator [Gemmatimonadaceae bacterium]|nr:TetR/AcrR family transcriptional regulator [Acetobacteraceae bacterium]
MAKAEEIRMTETSRFSDHHEALSEPLRVTDGTPLPPSSPRKVGLRRKEQVRAVETRQAIMEAALEEFAQNGFDAASVRNIAKRTGLQHSLITYHFHSKDLLWRAVAEDAHSQIRAQWEHLETGIDALSPIDRIARRYCAFLRFTIEHPHFHQFMSRESSPGSPRLPWMVETLLRPSMALVLPDIRLAQETGALPAGNPVLIHYMLVGMASAFSSLSDEIELSAGITIADGQAVEDYVSIFSAFALAFRDPVGG